MCVYDTTEQLLEALRVQHTEIHVETIEETLSEENFSVAEAETGTVVDVRTWVERDGNVLLIHDRNSPNIWTEPGGTPEPNEGFEVTAQREVTEETGIDCTITGLRGVVCHIRRLENDPSDEAVLYQLFYTADGHAGDVQKQTEEIRDVRWWASLPESFASDLGAPEWF